jgi:predicted flap endonuclease-1-like 5' DNA nuclease
MKRFLRVLLPAAVVAGLVWFLRERLVPVPQPPDPSPPPFRTTPPKTGQRAASPGAAAVADDLTEVKGIGPIYRSRLADVGVTTFAGLAGADAGELSAAIGVSDQQIEDWQRQARTLS